MRLILFFALLAMLGIAAFLTLDLDAFGRWALEEQRGFQNNMASAVRGLKSGETGAWAALLAAAGAYGFFHAVGPGHGKVLIGGVGLGSTVSATRLLSISIVSSLAQAFWAIILVYGGFFALEATARQMTNLAETFLAPASYLAIAAIGGILIWRGTRAFKRANKPSHHKHHSHGHHHDHVHDDHCGCHAHGPTPEEVEELTSLRDTLALIASIAVRPCTGAIFLLVIAWQMDVLAAGAAAVVVMGLGTATLTSLVAVSSVAARTVTLASASKLGTVVQIMPGIQILVGTLILWISLTLFSLAV